MHRTRRFAGLLSLLGLTLGAGQGFADDQPKAQPQVEFMNRVDRQGVVAEVTKDSITVAFPELVYRAPIIRLYGIDLWGNKVAPAEPNKKFAVSETLAAGKTPKEPRPRLLPGRLRAEQYHVSPANMYRLSDVKVGDWVYVIYARVDGVDTCDHISIVKRPGGLVPPLPEEAEALIDHVAIWKARHPGMPLPEGLRKRPYIPYHERMNAYWDLEDKGIPYPEKFGPDRRFPVAPPPREVPPLSPAIDR